MTAAIYKFFNNRINLLLLGFALFPLFFTKYVESLCDQYLKPVYLNLSSNWIVDVVSLCLCVLIVLYYLERYKKEHLLSAFRVWLLVIGTGWYTYFRFQVGWNYGHFSFWDSLYYLDSIIFLCGVNLLYCGLPRNQKTVITFYEKIELVFVHIKWKWRRFLVSKKWFTKKPANTIKNKKCFLTDQSLEFDTSDYLGRKEYANSITTTILNTLEKDHHTFAIGIVGEWGAGKTSFFKMMKASEDIKNGKAIYIDFNPWLNHQNKDIVGNFFAELKEVLGERDSKLSFQLDQYVKQLTTLDDNIYLKTIDFLTKLIFGTKSIETIFSDINKSIKRLEKPIIIFIDDLDRLDSSELVEVIKLIRVSANFKNTAFVAAYDKEYVSKAIEAITKHNQNLFLEKIFQAEFHLPTFEVKRLKNYLSWELRQVVEERFHEGINSYLRSEQPILNKSILTLRDVKRFVNQFHIDFNQVKDEVLLSDFMDLALIKFKHFGLYEFIKKEGSNFLQQYENDSNTARKLPFFKLKLKELDILKEKYEKQGKEIDLYMLEYLFPPLNDNNAISYSKDNEVSIFRPSNFNTYFSLKLLEGRLSVKDFEEARAFSTQEFIERLQVWIDSGLKLEWDIYEKLQWSSVEYRDKEDRLKLIEASLLYCYYQFTQESRITIENGIELVFEHLKQKDLYNDISVDVCKMFQENKNVPKAIVASILCKVREIELKVPDHAKYILNLEQIKDLLCFLLKETFAQTNKFTDEIWEIYSYCEYTGDEESGISERVHEDINRVMLDFARDKDTRGFFEKIIANHGYDSYYYQGKVYSHLFPWKNDTEKFILELKDSKLKSIITTFNQRVRSNLDSSSGIFDFEGELDI